MSTRSLLSCQALRAALMLSLLAAQRVFGQAAPDPNISRSPPTWLGYIIVFVLVVMVVSVSLMPSKRSHQD